ncbi:MAG: peroxiredoxin family protein [Pirellulaceae bacterium]|jgi:peroxiredoxin Q/BCP
MMKKIICAVAMVCIVHATTVSADELIVGDDAPEMELAGSDGKIYKLSDFKDKKAVIIAWFPKAFTGGCKVECESFRRSADDLGKFNVVLLAASCDPLERNTAFANALKVDYPILSDPDGKVATAYGIFGKLRKYSSRTTFIVGKDGKLLSIDRKVDVENHGRDLVEKLGELGVEMVE